MSWLKKALDRELDLQEKTNLKILDVGCGNGHLSAYMVHLEYHVTAIDIYEGAIDTAKKLYDTEDISFVHTALEDVKGEFDVITGFEVLEHVDDLNNFLDNISGHLAPGGSLIISVPNGWSLEEMIRRVLQHTFFGNKIKSWLRKTGTLPKSSSQSEADSPHVRFWQYYTWRRELDKQGFSLLQVSNVSLFFKQFYYMGWRKFIKPNNILFITFDRIDNFLVSFLPHFLSDGWLMVWRKNK